MATVEGIDFPGLEYFIEMCNVAGRDPRNVIGNGGNASVLSADGSYRIIKASGKRLSVMTPQEMTVVDVSKVLALLDVTYNSDPHEREAVYQEGLIDCVVGDRSKIPSVETTMHALFDYPFVVHFHPTFSGAVLCSEESEKFFRDYCPTEHILLDYNDPGITLAKDARSSLDGRFPPPVVAQKNHGFFAGATSVDDLFKINSIIIGHARDLVSQALEAHGEHWNPFGEVNPDFEEKSFYDCEPVLEALYSYVFQTDSPSGRLTVFDGSLPVLAFEKEEVGRIYFLATKLAKQYAKSVTPASVHSFSHLSPDHVVYLGTTAEFIPYDAFSDPRLVEASVTPTSAVYVIEGAGVAVVAGHLHNESPEKKGPIRALFADDILRIRHAASALGPIIELNPENVAFIDKWIVESYRSAQANK